MTASPRYFTPAISSKKRVTHRRKFSHDRSFDPSPSSRALTPFASKTSVQAVVAATPRARGSRRKCVGPSSLRLAGSLAFVLFLYWSQVYIKNSSGLSALQGVTWKLISFSRPSTSTLTLILIWSGCAWGSQKSQEEPCSCPS